MRSTPAAMEIHTGNRTRRSASAEPVPEGFQITVRDQAGNVPTRKGRHRPKPDAGRWDVHRFGTGPGYSVGTAQPGRCYSCRRPWYPDLSWWSMVTSASREMGCRHLLTACRPRPAHSNGLVGRRIVRRMHQKRSPSWMKSRNPWPGLARPAIRPVSLDLKACIRKFPPVHQSSCLGKQASTGLVARS